MKVISANIAQPQTVIFKNKQVHSGIFKEPTEEAIYLDYEGVVNDHVMDRKVHGGPDKACYIFSADYYPFWKGKYINLKWRYGMFGENLTVEGLREDKIHPGDVFKIGQAVVQVSQPRQPCYKLGIKFNDPGIIKEFIKHNHPGIYVRVFEPGLVKKGDQLIAVKTSRDSITISELFNLLYQKDKNAELLRKALNNKNIPLNVIKDLK